MFLIEQLACQMETLEFNQSLCSQPWYLPTFFDSTITAR